MIRTSELTVEFYDNPANIEQAGIYWIHYDDTTPTLSAMDLVTYFRKVDFCLGQGNPSRWLRRFMHAAAEAGFESRPNLLAGDGYSLVHAERKGRPAWTARAQFFSDRLPHTEFGRGGEDYYAPMSVIAFMQHLVDLTPDNLLSKLSDDLRRTLNVSDGSSVPASAEMCEAADRAATRLAGNDHIMWFILPMMMDIEKPARWVYGPVDLTANTYSNRAFGGTTLDNGLPMPVPALAAEWTWPHAHSRPASGSYGPRYFPDYPNPSFVCSIKHSTLQDIAKGLFGVVDGVMAQGGAITKDDLTEVDLATHVFGSPERYMSYIEWLASDHSEYFVNPGIRREAHYGIAEYMTFDDPDEARGWLDSGNRLFAVSREDAAKLGSMMTVDEHKIDAILKEFEAQE